MNPAYSIFSIIPFLNVVGTLDTVSSGGCVVSERQLTWWTDGLNIFCAFLRGRTAYSVLNSGDRLVANSAKIVTREQNCRDGPDVDSTWDR